jgi:general secretion pathway protein F
LVGSLEALLTQIPNPLLKKSLAQIKESVNEGNSLAFALAQHPRLFSNIYINMVRAGEASGALDIVLNRLADYGERQEALKGRFKAALAYPAFMVLIGASVLLFLMTVVVPDITSVFADMNQTLPAPTMILIGISHFLASFWWALFLVGLVAAVSLWKFSKTTRGERISDKLKLKFPLLGKINQKIALARFARTLGTLLESGVPLLTAMDIVRNVVNNHWISDEIDSAMVDVEAGKSLAVPLSRSAWFPSMAIQMISVGEQSGELEAMLQKIADTYEKDVESQIMALTSMLEPVMILFMAMIVFFIVVSILLPIFEMNQMVR